MLFVNLARELEIGEVAEDPVICECVVDDCRELASCGYNRFAGSAPALNTSRARHATDIATRWCLRATAA